jgi:hypothetical protein
MTPSTIPIVGNSNNNMEHSLPADLKPEVGNEIVNLIV